MHFLTELANTECHRYSRSVDKNAIVRCLDQIWLLIHDLQQVHPHVQVDFDNFNTTARDFVVIFFFT